MPRGLYRLARRTENLSLVALDVGIVATAWLVGIFAGFEATIPEEVRGWVPVLLAVPVAVTVAVHHGVGLYGPVWRFASIEEGLRTVAAVIIGTAASTVGLVVVTSMGAIDLPMYTVPPVAALVVLLGCGGVRFQARLFALERQSERPADRSKALIVGAGGPGAALAYELANTTSGQDLDVVGFVDDDPALQQRSVRTIPVLGNTDRIEELCETHGVDRVLIAMPEAGRERIRPIIDRALRTSAQVKVLHQATDRASGPVHNVRDLDLSDLIGREAAPVDTDDIAHVLQGATVLVTGAGGSIGSEIARQVARYEPSRLLLLDRDETLLHEVAVGPLADAELVLLDIRDHERIRRLLHEHRPEVVFHAAANKHVPILERYPLEAITTNVISTWELAQAAAESGCERFVHLSTDKAAAPCSVMGATKRVSERLVAGLGRHHDLPYVAVRFGNVLGSRGSVVPTFLRQILDGGPVTVTSSEMTRYFMTIPEAVSLVLQAGAMSDEGRTYLLDMGEPASILGLARQMIRLAGMRPDEDVAIEFTGVRPGERLHEQLHDDAEDLEASAHPSISGLSPRVVEDWDELVMFMKELEKAASAGDEGGARRLLGELLRSGGVDCDLDEPIVLDITASEDAAVLDVSGNGNGVAPRNGKRVAARDVEHVTSCRAEEALGGDADLAPADRP